MRRAKTSIKTGVPPITALLDPKEKYTLDSLTCRLQIEGRFFQEQHVGTAKPVEYWLRSRTNSKQTYIFTRREPLAIVVSVIMLCLYLEGTRFAIQTDDDLLKWAFNLTDETGRLARSWLRQPKFDFHAVHHACNKHPGADVFSGPRPSGK